MDPFAKALQATPKARTSSYKAANTLSPELEKNLNSNTNKSVNGLNPFSEALARVGGNKLGDLAGNQNQLSSSEREQQALDLAKERRREAARLSRFKEINQVDLSAVYDKKALDVQKRLELTREKLNNFAKEVKAFSKAVDVAVFQEVVDQGTEGTGLSAYFDKLQQFIELLRQKVHSARTWLNVQSAKSKKKKGHMPGIKIGGNQFEQTANVYKQQDNAEVGTTYSNG